ncbi:VanZ family protein [Galbitalea soli]|uniref:VanZ family protein n=1 Tax=Galbitalea soli TaxID=1268042 RepID=A0A7C9TP18_9MICO|nr:VanZ family protein [Galbitalea soli]NEM90378.1 VanZ family protein [Galbitalea soli]NYJ31088.1 glycopeptide antibiotics resistance protein [Galbitalea soli]
MFRRHPVLALVTLAYLGLVAWMTLGPQRVHPHDSLVLAVLHLLRGHAQTAWVTYSGIEFTSNILMFLPIGVFFVLLFGRGKWWLAVLMGVLLTIAIETAQLWIPGRVSDIRDIIANSSGSTIGVLVALVLTAGKARRLRRARAAGAV